MAISEKRERNYLRVPLETLREVEAFAARCDVPTRSAARFLLSIGLETVRMHPELAAEVLKAQQSVGSPAPPSPQSSEGTPEVAAV